MTAYCVANVAKVGEIDVESDYLPHVVQCENGGASLEAMRAQAVAARTYLYYKLETTGSIQDGQSDQVYSCPSLPSPLAVEAVLNTSGQYLSYHGKVLAAFYVAGSKQDPPNCQGKNEAATEKFVTYNRGLFGSGVHQSSLGLIDPANRRNRGCLSQWGSRCLAELGNSYFDILGFYYAKDVSVESAAGPCITPLDRAPRGQLDESSCNRILGWAQDPDIASQPISVWLSFDAPMSDPSSKPISVSASDSRKELCNNLGSCHHGFESALPTRLRDSTPHSFWLYAISDGGGEPVLLAQSPAPLRCSPPAPPLSPAIAVRRRLDSANALEAWSFNPLLDIAQYDELELAEYLEGPPWPEAPVLTFDKDKNLWLLDQGSKRQISPQVADAYRLGSSALVDIPNEKLEKIPIGPAIRPRPFLMKGPGDAIYVLDSIW